MQVIHRICAIEKRAAKIHLTLAELCRLASVPSSTVWRWRAGRVSPTERRAAEHLSRLEDRLRKRERALRRVLACGQRRAS